MSTHEQEKPQPSSPEKPEVPKGTKVPDFRADRLKTEEHVFAPERVAEYGDYDYEAGDPAIGSPDVNPASGHPPVIDPNLTGAAVTHPVKAVPAVSPEAPATPVLITEEAQRQAIANTEIAVQVEVEKPKSKHVPQAHPKHKVPTDKQVAAKRKAALVELNESAQAAKSKGEK